MDMTVVPWEKSRRAHTAPAWVWEEEEVRGWVPPKQPEARVRTLQTGRHLPPIPTPIHPNRSVSVFPLWSMLDSSVGEQTGKTEG